MAADNEPPEELVPVFHTDDPGLLPLAELALRNAQIEYVVRRSSLIPPALLGKRTDFANPTESIRHHRPRGGRGPGARAARRPGHGRTARRTASARSDRWPNGRAKGRRRFCCRTSTPAPTSAASASATWRRSPTRSKKTTRRRSAYYITSATIDLLQESGVDPTTISLLRLALGDREAFLLRWQKIEE